MTNFKLKAGPKMFIFESFLSPNFRSGLPELKVQRVNISDVNAVMGLPDSDVFFDRNWSILTKNDLFDQGLLSWIS